MRKEIQNRLEDFSVMIYNLSKTAAKEYFANYMIKQLLRSAASAALNYGEAQSAETKKDFIHKTGIVLKELRESNINLNILLKSEIINDTGLLHLAMEESHQLVSIFYRTVQTAKKNQ